MKRFKYILFLIILTTMIFCKAEQSPADWSVEKVEIEAAEMLRKYLHDMNTKGLLSEFEHLDSTEAFFWVPPGYQTKLDFDSVKTILKKNAPFLMSINNQWTSLHVQALEPNHCVYTGEINSTTVTTSQDTTHVHMLETGVLKKGADGWKILCGQSRIKE